MCCFSAEVAAFPGMEGCSLPKAYVHPVVKRSLEPLWAEYVLVLFQRQHPCMIMLRALGERREDMRAQGAHEGALQGMLTAAQTNLLGMGEAKPGQSCLMAFQPGIQTTCWSHFSLEAPIGPHWHCWVQLHRCQRCCLPRPSSRMLCTDGHVPTSPTAAMGISWTLQAGDTNLCSFFS